MLYDIGVKQYSHEEARDLLEIAELRYNRSSTVLASQIPHEKWYDLIPDPTIADAFGGGLSRIQICNKSSISGLFHFLFVFIKMTKSVLVYG